MRNARRVSLCGWFVVAAVSLGGGVSCSRRGLPDAVAGIGGARAGSGGSGASGGGAVAGGAAGSGSTGTGGAAGLPAACAGPSDPRLVLADQRILRLTGSELVNTVRYLVDDTEATALVSGGVIAGNDLVESLRRFPPLDEPYIDGTSFPVLDRVASHVATYISDNFARITGCTTDACATAYLDKMAGKAYRRRLTPDEQARFTALYTKLRNPQTVNGYVVTFTMQEAASLAVDALLRSPQTLWRWELGDAASASSAPAGIPLTDAELATQLSFFLTDQPPDQTLLAAADAGTLRANLALHLDAILATQPAHDWLRTIIEAYFQTNRLSRVPVDPSQFPLFTPALAADMSVGTRKFLDEVLWNGSLTDLLLSRTAFVNTSLAANIYGITVPAGATATTFVQTTLPAEQRSGLLTNAGFLTAHATVDGQSMLAPRGLLVDTVLLCMPNPGADARRLADAQTGQQQVALRAAQPACNSCHAQFDPYGLALENYDDIGRYRTIDGEGRPIDAHTTLPAAVGGGAVANAVELAQELAANPAFTNCMARALLQYAMVDPGTSVDVPLPPHQAGCATADVVQRYQRAGGGGFGDLVRATAASPAFALRRAAP